MTASTLWVLIWLPQIIQAIMELPQPENVNLSSRHFVHLLTWESGPGSPRDLKYNVSYCMTESNHPWMLVPGCEHVERPLVCNLTEALRFPDKEYFIRVTAMRGTQASEKYYPVAFKPIKDTILDPPHLTVVPCNRALCVRLNPPMEHLRKIYDSFSYTLRVQRTSGSRAEFLVNTQHLKGETLKDLAPGKNYCVSVRFSDPLVPRKSEYSHPQCANTAAPYTADMVISVVVCMVILVILLFGVLMIYTGFIFIRQWWPLPPILTSIKHNGEMLAVFCDGPGCLPAYIESTAPPTDEKGSDKRSVGNSEEEEVEEEAITGTDKIGYESWGAMNPLFSSSSSSPSPLSVSNALPDSCANSHTLLFLSKPGEPESDDLLTQSNPHLELRPLIDHVLSESNHPATESNPPRTSCVSLHSVHTQQELGLHFHSDTEELTEPEGNVQEANLLSVVFGLHAENPDVETDVAESSTAFSFEPWDRQEVDMEAVVTSDSEEEDDNSGYMRH